MRGQREEDSALSSFFRYHFPSHSAVIVADPALGSPAKRRPRSVLCRKDHKNFRLHDIPPLSDSMRSPVNAKQFVRISLPFPDTQQQSRWGEANATSQTPRHPRRSSADGVSLSKLVDPPIRSLDHVFRLRDAAAIRRIPVRRSSFQRPLDSVLEEALKHIDQERVSSGNGNSSSSLISDFSAVTI